MKPQLAAIFVVWADCIDLLPYAVENIRPCVDEVVIVWSRKSNHGQEMDYDLPRNCRLVQCEPVQRHPQHNEIAKRNAGLDSVKKDFTHFIMLDADEFYLQSEFIKQRRLIEEDNTLGTVCRIKTYFKSPTLSIGYDHTLVPFIHRVRNDLFYKLNYKRYPFAIQNGTPYIDPTRRLNISSGVRMADITMHHMSWIRRDFALKMQNSSANLRGSRGEVIMEDLRNAKPGYFCKGYQKVLRETENVFNLPIYD